MSVSVGSTITELLFKDDSFRPTNWTPNSLSTNGDELTIPVGTTAVRTTNLGFTMAITNDIYIRARPVNFSSSLTITIKEPPGPPIIATVSLPGSTNTYTLQKASVSSGAAGTVAEIDILASGTTSDSIIIDFIAFAKVSGNNIDFAGMQMDIQFDKKTVPQPIPNSVDIIQQLGINSRTVTLQSPKQDISIYNTLESMLVSNTPLLFNTVTQQATGYLISIEREIEAGWIPPLYDITAELIKADSSSS